MDADQFGIVVPGVHRLLTACAEPIERIGVAATANAAARLKNFLIICIASQPWNTELRTNRHYMMEYFARDNKVIFIESMGLRMPSFSLADLSRIAGKLRRIGNGKSQSMANLRPVDPLMFPIAMAGKSAMLDRLNMTLLKKQIEAAILKTDPTLPRILWTYIPSVWPLVGKFGESLLVYDCVDDFGAVAGYSKQILFDDRVMATRSDLVFTTSLPIFREKRQVNSNAVYAHACADSNLFNKAMSAETVVPPDIANIPKPILGYVGNLADHKQDFELLEHVCRKSPKWSLVLIGPHWSGGKESNHALENLRRLPNVFLLGAKPHDDLPGYLKAFDVCLIPQKNNDYARSSFPMKLFEYLGSGKPVVATWTETLSEYTDYIGLAHNYAEFTQAINHALQSDSTAARARRLKLAASNGWSRRIGIVEESVVKAAKKKGISHGQYFTGC
jgi:glycosyltransferase involved in cell wall biosynthesis